MVDNKRELITQNIKLTLESTSLAQVTRKKLHLDEWDTVPLAQLPYCSVMSGLPSPQSIKFSTRTQGRIDVIRSELTTAVTVFGQDNVTPDETISSLLQEIWAALFIDYRRGGHALQTVINPQIKTAVLDPYYAFEVEVLTEYHHDTTHI